MKQKFKEKLEAIHEDIMLSELQDETSFIKRYAKKYDIGYKIKSFDSEKGVLGSIRSVLQKFISSDDLAPDGSPGAMTQELKDTVRKKIPSQDDLPEDKMDSTINRIVRTELSSMRELSRLIKWHGMGFTKVRHKTSPAMIARGVSGIKDVRFNNRIFKISYLLKHSDDRVPLHPNCFPKKTIIEVKDVGEKYIENIKIGDIVKTHQSSWQKVIGLTQNYFNGELTVWKTLKATPNHPIFIEGGFIEISKLSDDTESFKGIVYNFEVENDNSYIANGIPVHNCACTYNLYK